MPSKTSIAVVVLAISAAVVFGGMHAENMSYQRREDKLRAMITERWEAPEYDDDAHPRSIAIRFNLDSDEYQSFARWLLEDDDITFTGAGKRIREAGSPIPLEPTETTPRRWVKSGEGYWVSSDGVCTWHGSNTPPPLR